MDNHAFLHDFIKVEKAASSIYSNLMKLLPEEKDFWKDLFDDEVEHVSFLNDVKSLGLTGEMQKIELPPSMPVINKAIKLAETITKKMNKGHISRKDALSMTLKLEESMVETYTNKLIAKLLSCENEDNYKKIVADEHRHINKIRIMIKSL